MKRRKIPKKKQLLTQLPQKDLKALREKHYHLQGGVCPILGCKYPIEDATLDHCHSTKKDTIGVNGKGLVRGVIQRQANSLEGKITNAYTRLGIHKFDITLPRFLRNLADFLESPPLDHLQLIHPTEKSKPKIISKASYNKLKKMLLKKKYSGKLPAYRMRKKGKSLKPAQKLTKPLQLLYDKVQLEPTYYKQ